MEINHACVKGSLSNLWINLVVVIQTQLTVPLVNIVLTAMGNSQLHSEFTMYDQPSDLQSPVAHGNWCYNVIAYGDCATIGNYVLQQGSLYVISTSEWKMASF